MRAFLQQVLTEYLDFDWWEKSAPESVRKKEREEYRASHPLERLTFEELIKVVDKPTWSKDKKITRGELLSLVSSINSVENLEEKLETKTQETFSDEILPNYLGDDDSWSDLKDKIKQVIKLRHKIMHHRPFWAYEYDDLEELRLDIKEILENVSSPTKQERERIEDEHEELVSATDNILEKNINEQILGLESDSLLSGKMPDTLTAGDLRAKSAEIGEGEIRVGDDRITPMGEITGKDLGPNLGDYEPVKMEDKITPAGVEAKIINKQDLMEALGAESEEELIEIIGEEAVASLFGSDLSSG